MDLMIENKCQVCGSASWIDLPNPNKFQSVTTAGRILNEPLSKSQCKSCGFVQRTKIEFLGLTDYYEHDYATYYERAGTNEFHNKRYLEIVSWMNSYIDDGLKLNRIIDIGCGQGWAMDIVRNLYPHSTIEGLEPSNYNVKVAREKDFQVYEGKLEDTNLMPNSYDLVFSNNVIQHVNNARDFLLQLKGLVTEDGVIVITCPNGAKPNIEILWGDQNFSFLPMNLLNLAKDIGFATTYWVSSEASASLPPAQLLILTNNKNYEHLVTDEKQAFIALDEIYKKRFDYLSSFEKINAYLIDQISGSESIYNFGASYWSSVLAGYCPGYWEKVTACLVDTASGFEKFLGKNILQYDSVIKEKNDALVIGTGPGWHEIIKGRFTGEWDKVISWSSFINY